MPLKPRKPPPVSRRFQRTEHRVRFGGRAPRQGYSEEQGGWSHAYQQLQKVARAHGARRSGGAGGLPKPPAAPRWKTYRQRVFVKTGYVHNQGGKGAWRARGQYIQRESATKGYGFSEQPGPDKPSQHMHTWEKAGDDRLWWMWISPEFGAALDLEEFTRSLLAEIERDLGLKLEWTAAVHRNTDHPHVHVGIRGVDKDGKPVTIPREYIRQDLHDRATRLATNRLGYRTDADIAQAQRDMVRQFRYTDLDRDIAKRRSSNGLVFANSGDTTIQGVALAMELHVEQRLAHLASIGLAERVSEHVWQVNLNLESILRAAQKVQDRLHTIQHFGVMSSDPRQPFVYSEWRALRSLEGRVLVHGQDDSRPVPYLLFEAVDGRIHYLEHRNEIRIAREQGLLEPGSYVAMRVAWVDAKPHWIVEDYGNAEKALERPDFLEACLKRGVQPALEYRGWLGVLRERLAEARYRNEAFSMGPARDPGQSRVPPSTNAPHEDAAFDNNAAFTDGSLPDRGPRPEPIITPEEARSEFWDALREAGLIVSGGPIMDGEWHRVPVEGGQPGNRSGSYRGHLDGLPAGYYKNFKLALEARWQASRPTAPMSAAARARRFAEIEAEQRMALAKREEKQRERAGWSQTLWKRALPIQSHAYLARKAVASFGLRVDRHGNLLVPMFDHAGTLWNVQRIAQDGAKVYVRDAKRYGLFGTIGDVRAADTILFAEGYATAATVHEATGLPVVITFDSGGILPVVKSFREHHPDKALLIAADNDHHLPRRLAGTGKPLANVGIEKAEEAARAVGGYVVAPEFSDTDGGTDWNDYAHQHGNEAARERLTSAIRYVQRLQKGRGRSQ